MPEENQENKFESELILLLKFEGVEDVIQAYNQILQVQNNLGNSSESLIKKHGSVKKAVKAVTKEYLASNAVAKKSLDGQSKAADKLRGRFKRLSYELREVTGSMKKLAFPASFGAALRTIDQYNKTMLSLSASVNRLGIGLTSLEGDLQRIGRATSLTRVETNKLFDDFQSGMRVVSVSDFEDIMKRIRNIVGSNAVAMGKMQSTLAELSQAYPSLSRSLIELANSEGAISSVEKGMLQTRVRNLYLIGKISSAQYKQISSYVSGNQQIGKIDTERQKKMDAQTKALQDFRRQMETVSMTVGKEILPHLVKVANILNQWNSGVRSFKKDLAIIAGIWATVKFGPGLLGRGVRKLAGGSMGGGGLGGKRRGGALSAITGAGATPVRVVNFRQMYAMQKYSRNPARLLRMERGATTFKRGGITGKMAGFAGKARGVGTGALAIAGGAAMMAGGWKLGDTLKDAAADMKLAGNTTKAMWTEIAGAASMIGGQVAGFATIGARFFGPMGALIGAGVGFLTGAITTIRDEITGKRDEEARKRKEEGGAFKKEFKSEEEEVRKKELEAKNIESMRKKAIKRAGQEGLGTVYGQAIEAEAAAQKEYDKVVGKAKYAGRHKKIAEDEATFKEAQAKFDRESAAMSKAKKDGAQKYLKELEDQLDTTKEKLEEEEKSDSQLQKALRTLKETKGVAEELTALSEKQRQIAQDIGSLQQAQSGYLDAIVQKMALTGQINLGEISSELGKNVKLLQAEAVAYGEVIKILESDLLLTEKKDKLENSDDSKVRAAYKGLKDAGVKFEDQLQIKEAILQANIKIVNLGKNITQSALSTLEAYSKQKEQAGLLATKAGILVQLADNFAIGVGASAEMRINQYKAEEKAIKVLQSQLSIMHSEIAAGRENEAVRNKVLEIENEILQRQQSQAQQVKALRDGWISALSAQNTAMGGFTDIIMTSNKGLAQMQRLSGSVRSELTGAIAKRNELGKITENVGMDVSERFSYRQGAGPSMASVVGGGKIGGKGKYQEAWGGKVGGMDKRLLETMYVEGIRQAIEQAGRSVTGGDADALGAASNIARGAYVERGSMRGGTGDRRPKSVGRDRYDVSGGGSRIYSSDKRDMVRSKKIEETQADMMAEEVYIKATNVYIEGKNLLKVLENKEGASTRGYIPKDSKEDKIRSQKQEIGIIKAQLRASSKNMTSKERVAKEKELKTSQSKLVELEGSKKKGVTKQPVSKDFKKMQDEYKSQQQHVGRLGTRHDIMMGTGAYKGDAETEAKKEIEQAEQKLIETREKINTVKKNDIRKAVFKTRKAKILKEASLLGEIEEHPTNFNQPIEGIYDDFEKTIKDIQKRSRAKSQELINSSFESRDKWTKQQNIINTYNRVKKEHGGKIPDAILDKGLLDKVQRELVTPFLKLTGSGKIEEARELVGVPKPNALLKPGSMPWGSNRSSIDDFPLVDKFKDLYKQYDKLSEEKSRTDRWIKRGKTTSATFTAKAAETKNVNKRYDYSKIASDAQGEVDILEKANTKLEAKLKVIAEEMQDMSKGSHQYGRSDAESVLLVAKQGGPAASKNILDSLFDDYLVKDKKLDDFHKIGEDFDWSEFRASPNKDDNISNEELALFKEINKEAPDSMSAEPKEFTREERSKKVKKYNSDRKRLKDLRKSSKAAKIATKQYMKRGGDKKDTSSYDDYLKIEKESKELKAKLIKTKTELGLDSKKPIVPRDSEVKVFLPNAGNIEAVTGETPSEVVKGAGAATAGAGFVEKGAPSMFSPSGVPIELETGVATTGASKTSAFGMADKWEKEKVKIAQASRAYNSIMDQLQNKNTPKNKLPKLEQQAKFLGGYLDTASANQAERRQQVMQITGEKTMPDDEFINPRYRGPSALVAPVPIGGASQLTVNAININSTIKVMGVSEIVEAGVNLARDGITQGIGEALGDYSTSILV